MIQLTVFKLYTILPEKKDKKRENVEVGDHESRAEWSKPQSPGME